VIPAEFLGAFVGAILVWLAYLPHWKPTESAGFKLGVFCTGPGIRNLPANFVTEVIGTFMLIVGVGAMASKVVSTPSGFGPGLFPYLVGMLVWGIGLSLGGPTGYAINPARDLGPRIAHALLPIPGKGGSDWGYAGIPVFGPIVGALIAAWVLRIIA
jgi:glycerol uptake facilitator protein